MVKTKATRRAATGTPRRRVVYALGIALTAAGAAGAWSVRGDSAPADSPPSDSARADALQSAQSAHPAEAAGAQHGSPGLHDESQSPVPDSEGSASWPAGDVFPKLPPSRPMDKQYEILLRRSIFAEPGHQMTQDDAAGRPESRLVLRGVIVRDGQITAYVEDASASTPGGGPAIVALHAGDRIGPGRLRRVTLQGVDYDTGAGPRRVEIGQSLDGTQTADSQGVDQPGNPGNQANPQDAGNHDRAESPQLASARRPGQLNLGAAATAGQRTPQRPPTTAPAVRPSGDRRGDGSGR